MGDHSRLGVALIYLSYWNQYSNMVWRGGVWMEENQIVIKKSNIVYVLAGACIGAVLGIMAYYGNWLG